MSERGGKDNHESPVAAIYLFSINIQISFFFFFWGGGGKETCKAPY